MKHTWETFDAVAKYIKLQGHKDALVRVQPSPNGQYLWQFRNTVSYAPTIESAKDHVEAGAEFFAVMRRNPYV